MILKHSLCLLTVIWLPVAGHAQQNEAKVPVQIRAVLHDPVHPTADLFYTDKSGAVTRLNFKPQDLTAALSMQPVNGSLVLYDKAATKGLYYLEDDERGQKQTAYQVLVASTTELLSKDRGDLWDSGKVVSEQSVLLEYHGKPQESWQQCHWKARVWDKDGKASEWSQPAAWTMGLLDSNAWQAKWIGAGTTQPKSLLLRRDFMVKSRLRRAVVAVCGLGHYELTLNGRKVSEDVLTPGWTKYNKTCLYDMYDVTRVLKPGSNAMGFMLGNGMYNVIGGRYAKFGGSFGPQKVIAQLRLEYENGKSEAIITDEQYRIHSGPVTFTCVYGGEDYDARLCQPGWDQPGFPDAKWEPAVVTQGPGGTLKGLSCAAPPVRRFDTLKPVKTTTIKPGVTLYDLGQNAAQMPRITVSGPAGSTVKILPAEIVRKDNTVDQTSVGGDISCSYTLDGSGQETWSPRFFYCGYRYLQIECSAATQGGALPVVESVEGRVVHTSSTPIGEFSSSNELINRIHTMIRWAQRSNMVSVMTDCPHREKLGWLKQTHLNGPALRFNYDLNVFFGKLMNDMADSQLDNGLIPDIAPEFTVFDGGFRDSPEWGSAFPQVAWHQYQFAGDIELLRRYYDGMARYVAYLEGKAKNFIIAYGLGDWRALEGTPSDITATTIFYDDVRILARSAKLLGKTTDAARYTKLAEDRKREGQKLSMEVTIPSNTTATLHVPTKEAAAVTESGKPASEAKGVKFLRMENGAAVYAVGSGSYQFQSILADAVK